MILNKEIILLEPDYVSSNRIMIQDCLMLLHHNVKLYHLYHYCKKKKIIIKKQSKPIYICLFCRSQLLGPLRQSSVKQSDSAENARKNAIEKKILVRNVVRVRNVAFLRNMNYELLVRPLSRSIWCWFWKTGDPGSNPAEVLNVSISIFLWLNGSILESFFVCLALCGVEPVDC